MAIGKKDGARSSTIFGVLQVAILGAILLAIGLGIAATYVRQAVGRIQVDPKVLSDVMRDTVVVTLRQGSPAEKIDVIESLAEVAPADMTPFVSSLTEATKDADPKVREAATAALRRIAPPGATPQ